MSPALMALLAIAGTILFFAVPLLALALAVVITRLNKRQPIAPPVLRASKLMLVFLFLAIPLFIFSGVTQSPHGYPAGWLADALLTCGALLGLRLLWLRPQPRILARLAGPLTVSVLLLTVFTAFSLHIGAQAYEIERYNNPNMAVVQADLAQNPNDSAAHMSMGYDLMSHHDPKNAAIEFQRTAQLEPTGSSHKDEALFMLGHMLTQSGQRTQAFAVYQQLATQNDVWGNRAKQYVRTDGK